jgi:hypothetical protein
MGFQHAVAFTSDNYHSKTEFQEYMLSGDQCSLKLLARKGGIVYKHETPGDFAFSDEVGKNSQSLGFDFHCVGNVSGNYCNDIWFQELVLEDPSTVKIMKVVFYKNVNPVLNSIVYAANTNAVAPPRPRSVRYCLSNQNQAVEGVVFVGNEKSHQAWRAIKILKTLRFN